MTAEPIDHTAPTVTAHPAPPVMARTEVAGVCRCGHGTEAHQHFRPGDDCGACGSSTCRTYRRQDSTSLAGRVRGLATAAQALRRPRAR